MNDLICTRASILSGARLVSLLNTRNKLRALGFRAASKDAGVNCGKENQLSYFAAAQPCAHPSTTRIGMRCAQDALREIFIGMRCAQDALRES